MVDDDLMPHEWMLVEEGESLTLVLRRSAGPIEAIIADAWGASRLLAETPTRGNVIPLPRRLDMRHPSMRSH